MTNDAPKTRPRRLGSTRTVSTTQGTTGPQVDERERPAPTPPQQDQKTGPPPTTQPRTGVSTSARRVPRYDDLERKEARLRPDQLAELSRLTRELARAARRSRPAGEPTARITDNTLIRVAVDLLLARGGELVGVDEDELRRSVGLQ